MIPVIFFGSYGVRVFVFLPLHTPSCLDGPACVLRCMSHASLAKLLIGQLWCCRALI